MGTNSAAPWTVGTTDPALYRNIMTVTLASSTSPAVGTTTMVTSSPAAPTVGQAVTFTATVSVPSPGAGTPTGTVTLSDANGTVCSGSLSETSPDTATCSSTYTSSASDLVTATYGGDSNYASSSGTDTVTVAGLPQAITFTSALPTKPIFGGTYTVVATGGASGNPVTFSAAAMSVCTVNGSTVTFTGVGTCTILANQAGTAKYLPAPTASEVIVVAKAPTTIKVANEGLLFFSVSAALTNLTTGAPLAGQVVTFTTGGSTFCTGVSNANGVASCSFLIGLSLFGTYSASYSGNTDYVGSSGSATL